MSPITTHSPVSPLTELFDWFESGWPAVQITVAEGILTISAERREEISEKGRSEFHYGSFRRRLALPPGAMEEKLAARYQDGILEVTAPIVAEQAQPRIIPVARGSAA